MERKIGERFEYKGVTLEVAEAPNGNICGDCYFLLKENMCFKSVDETGNCYERYRDDKKNVYFKEVKK